MLTSRSKYGEKIVVTNGENKIGNIKYDLEIREADNIGFLKSFDIFNGENYQGHLLIKNHLQIDKISNLVRKFILFYIFRYILKHIFF